MSNPGCGETVSERGARACVHVIEAEPELIEARFHLGSSAFSSLR